MARLTRNITVVTSIANHFAMMSCSKPPMMNGSPEIGVVKLDAHEKNSYFILAHSGIEAYRKYRSPGQSIVSHHPTFAGAVISTGYPWQKANCLQSSSLFLNLTGYPHLSA